MHVMHILNQSGDETLQWNPEDTESVEKAKGRFETLKEQGYRFYETVLQKGREITSFDPKLGQIIAAPKATGGPVTTFLA